MPPSSPRSLHAARFETEKLSPGQKDCNRKPDMEIESAHPVGWEQVELPGNSVEGQTVWSEFQDTWLQSPSKAALPEQLQGFQVAVEQLQHKRDNLNWIQGQHQALEMLLQGYQALKTQLRQSKALTQEQERERSLQIERHQHMREQLRQAETSVHILESSLDLYKKKYRAALGRVGELENQMHHLQEEAIHLWSSGQAEDSLGQLSAREMGWAMQLTSQQDQTIQELQGQLAASHSMLLQQKEAVASLRREVASYKLTHGCSNAKHRKQMVSQEILRQKLQQAEEEGLQQQAEAYQALVQELKLQLAREAEQNSSTLKDLARLELAVQSLCQEAAPEQNWQLRRYACPVQALLEQSHQLCAQKEWKPDRLLQRAWTNCSIFWDQAHPLNAASQEAKQGRAASWPGGAPVLQPRRPNSPEQPGKAALEMNQDQPAERDLELQRLGKVDCPLEVLLGRGCLAEAELEMKSFLRGDGLPAAPTSARELMEELSRSKRQPLQAASMLELEILRQQLQKTERRMQTLQACVTEQKAESHSLQEQLTKQTAVLGLVHGCFRQARLQLQHQATAEIESLQISLEASRAGHHWLHQESEVVVADVRQWVKEQKQINEELGHKLRTQIKQIAQLTGERDLLHQLLERLQQENQQLKNEAKEKRIVCERIKALHNSDLEPQAVLQQLWHILLL